jgi:hypothetical protein
MSNEITYDGSNLDEIREFVGTDGFGAPLLVEDAAGYLANWSGKAMVYNGHNRGWQLLLKGDRVVTKNYNHFVIPDLR